MQEHLAAAKPKRIWTYWRRILNSIWRLTT